MTISETEDMEMRCSIKVDPASYVTSKITFGLNDDKGREIGMVIKRFNATATEAEYGYDVPHAGEILGVSVMAARDGIEYGASNSRQWFGDEKDRDEFIAKRVRETKKRYEKQYL